MSGRSFLGKTNQAIIAHIKQSGCRVRCYDKHLIDNGQAAGTFHPTPMGGLISIALDGWHQREISVVLLHEFGHFLQWKEGFMAEVDSIIDGWTVFQEWLEGKKFPAKTLEDALNAILSLEYDAYVRGWDVTKILRIYPCAGAFYWNIAHSYISYIKYAFLTRTWGTYVLLHTKRRPLTIEEVYAPITHSEYSKIASRTVS